MARDLTSPWTYEGLMTGSISVYLSLICDCLLCDYFIIFVFILHHDTFALYFFCVVDLIVVHCTIIFYMVHIVYLLFL